MITLFTALWWRAALVRAGRTAAVIAVPYLPAVALSNVSWWGLLSAVVLGFVLSILTSLAGLSEATGARVNYWFALFERAVKTFSQALVAGVGTAIFVTDVDWLSILSLAATSTLGTLLLAVISDLPETDKPLAATTIPVTSATPDGSASSVETTAVPVVASVPTNAVSTKSETQIPFTGV